MPDTPEHPEPGLERRVARLEEDMREVKATLTRLEPMIVRIDAMLQATLPHLATKAELADLRLASKAELDDFRLASKAGLDELRLVTGTELAALRADLADKPGKAYLWSVLAVLIAAYAAGLAALAVMH